MTPERYAQVGQLYHEALELAPTCRAEFLDRACGEDAELRREVERLIANHEEAGSFLTSPALEVAAQEIAADEAGSAAGRVIGHYRVLSLLGAGGMGEVYLAEDTRLGRKVALKLLPARFTQDADRLRRFTKEAKAASALNHPNIITIHEVGQTDDSHFIVSEFVEGQTLRQQMAHARLSVRQTLEVAVQIAGALEVAHAAGIIHRDIKPENVMVRPDGIVKVLDFGLAKLTEKQADELSTDASTLTTEPGMVMGTASYMSPEQGRGQKVDARSDIFSLGVVLYELVAGQAPFEGVNAFEVIAAILEREPLPLSQHQAEVPAELQRIVSQALRKDREERYQTVKELLLDLKDFKQELELAARHQRSVQPGARGQVIAAKPGGEAGDKAAVMAVAQVGERAAAHPTSSAADLVRWLTKRRLMATGLLLAGLVVAVYYLQTAKRTEETKAGARVKSIAVLPFKFIGATQEEEYLGLGLSDAMITKFGNLRQVVVRPTSAVLKYQGEQQEAAAAVKALELDDALAEAHASLATYYYRYEFDWAAAEKEYQRTLALSPHYASARGWYGSLLVQMGRFGEGLSEVKQAQALDPLSLIINIQVGLAFFCARQYDQASEQFQKIIKMDPAFGHAHDCLAQVYEQQQKYDAAITELIKAHTTASGVTEGGLALREAYAAAGWRGFWQKRLEQTLAWAKRGYFDKRYIAMIYLRLGEKEQALEWLQKAYEDHESALTMIKVHPVFDGLRSDPRFVDLVRRIGLTP